MFRKKMLVMTVLLVLCLSVGNVLASVPVAPSSDPLSLLIGAYGKQISATSLGVQSETKTTISAIADGVSVQVAADLGIDAAIRKSGEIYLRVELPKVFFPMAPDQAQAELYIKDKIMLTKLPGQMWKQTDLQQQIPNLGAFDQLITTELTNLLRNAQIELTAQDVVESGKRYVDITGKVDGEKLYSAIRARILELSAQYPLAPEQLAQIDQILAPSMKTLQSSFVCRIDPESREMVRMHSEMTMTLDLQGVTPLAVKFGLQTVVDADYLYGDAVQMPVITPEMIAQPELGPEVPADPKQEISTPTTPAPTSTPTPIITP